MEQQYDEDYLLKLVDLSVEENIQLDFKDSRALMNTPRTKADISKDVSAFANSAGGQIIYGITETKGHQASTLDDGCDPATITKEWLENIILSRVQPRIEGIRIYPIPLKSHRPGRVAYVVEIPSSLQGPHMASDHRYYKRWNFQSIPMEDYEVRDVANRANGPDITLRFLLSNIELKGGAVIPLANLSYRQNGSRLNVLLQVIATNRSPVPAEYVLYRVALSHNWTGLSIPSGMESESGEITVDGSNIPAKIVCRKQLIPTQFPLFQGIEFLVIDGMLLSLPSFTDQPLIIMAQVQAPIMSIRSFIFKLKQANDLLSVIE